MLRFTLVLFAIASLAAGAEASPLHRPKGVVNFPGDPAKSLSSTRGVIVDFVDPDPGAEDHIFRLRLRYPDGRVEPIHDFGRNADVSWSPDGRWLWVTDWIGSNIADCLIFTTPREHAAQLSLTTVIAHGPFADARRDLSHNSHGYVSCTRWSSPSKVDVEFRGDDFPRRFDYRFVYNVRTGRLTRLGLPPSRGRAE